MKKVIIITIFFTFFSCVLFSQTTYDWLDYAPDGNWKQGADGARWNPDGLWDQPPAGNILRFNNNHQLSMTNNVSNYSVHQIIFGSSNSTSRSISGNDLNVNDWSGADPKIKNLSTASHSISLNIIGDSDDPLEINPVEGDLSISGTINNNGSNIFVYGDNSKLLTLGGVVSGTGKLIIQQDSKVKLTAANTYSDSTIINSGTLELGGSGVIADASNVILGGGTLSTGSSIGYDETVGTLTLSSNSTIDFGSGIHTLTFDASNSETWDGTTLTISNWSVGEKKLIIGTDNSGLTAGQLSKINFTGYGTRARILDDGEVIPDAFFATSAGNFSQTSVWYDGTVPSGEDVFIDNDIALDQNATVSSLSIDDTKTFTVNNGQTLQVTGGVTGNGSLAVNGTFQINAGGYTVMTPTYGASSTIIFDTGGEYSIDAATALWTTGSTLGQGVPNNVTVNTTSPLNIYEARDVTGDLTINSGGSVEHGNNIFIVQGNMLNSGSFSFVSDGAQPLTVYGDFTNYTEGSIILSNTIGGDLKVHGDFYDNGIFTANDRAVFLNGSSTQHLESTVAMDYLFINNSAGIILDSQLEINNDLDLTSGTIELGTNNLIINSTASISSSSTSSYIKTNNTGFLTRETGAKGDVLFPVGNSTYNPVTINNTGTTDNFSVKVLDGTPSNINDATKVVNRTWTITEESAGGSNATITLQ